MVPIPNGKAKKLLKEERISQLKDSWLSCTREGWIYEAQTLQEQQLMCQAGFPFILEFHRHTGSPHPVFPDIPAVPHLDGTLSSTQPWDEHKMD